MLKRFIELGLVATLTATLGTGVAWAQDEEGFDDEGELEAEGDVDLDAEGDDMDMDADGDVDVDAEDNGDMDADATEGEVSAEATPGAPVAGDYSAGATLMFPSGIGEDGIGLGSWAELKLAGRYQVNPQLSVGAEIPLLLLKEDLGIAEVSAFQGIWADARYQLNPMIHVNGFAGFGPAGRMFINPWGGVVLPGSPGDNKLGLGAGAGVRHQSGKIMVMADANLKLQLGSDTNDEGEETVGYVLQVPVWLLYQVNPKLAAGVVTGIYSGSGLSFDTNEGMTLPLLAGAMYTVSPQIGVGGFLGFSSLLVPDAAMGAPEVGVGDTLSLGVFAEYRK